MSTRLDALIGRVADPALAAELRSELAGQLRLREFGLVFEHHLPETVELPGLAIRAGVKARLLPDRGSVDAGDPTVWRVSSVAGGVASLTSADSDSTAQRGVDDLVRVADFSDPIYPGLVTTDELAHDEPDRPWHTLINAENFHALQALTFSHAGQVDTIYIDPPYNTGKDDWIYSDRHVGEQDGYRHSKWLSFMERRLEIARKLLKPTGIIIVAIGDDEHHRLRMLLDQIFGEQNFLSDVVWQGGRKNDSRYVSNGADYMLIYARDEGALQAREVRWRERKPGVDEALREASRIWTESEGDHVLATRTWRTWLREFKKSSGITDAVARYNNLDPATGEPVFTGRDVSWPGGGGPRYDVLHPVTGQPVKVPKTGWRYPSPQKMQEEIAAGRVRFGPDHGSGLQGVSFLAQLDEQATMSVFTTDRRRSAMRLETILGAKRFPNPKDCDVLMHWIGLVTPSDGTILDFFGGSGSTLEAVLRLNAADGGTRQCILVTNNEVGAKQERKLRKAGFRDGDPEWEAAGVCEYVTKPRIRTVLTGVRPDGSSFDDTVPGNVVFTNLTYEDPNMVELGLVFDRLARLLWLAAGAAGPCITKVPTAGWAATGHYAVLAALDAQRALFAAMTTERTAFIVTDDEGQFQQVAAHLPVGCRPVRLYESYLRPFQIPATTES